jgi:hypothetical protein
MADITQSSDGSSVTFSPSTTASDNWMREHYSVTPDVTVVFELPDEADQAAEFKAAAAEAGFSIAAFP